MKSWALLVALSAGLSAIGCGDEVIIEGENAVNCGPVTCAANEYCCDADCGLCEDASVACEEGCADGHDDGGQRLEAFHGFEQLLQLEDFLRDAFPGERQAGDIGQHDSNGECWRWTK